MVSDPQQEYADFLEQNPACYTISQSKIFMFVIKTIINSPKSFSELMEGVKPITEEDMRLILTALKSAKIISKPLASQAEIYCITPLGRKFMEKFQKTQDSFE